MTETKQDELITKRHLLFDIVVPSISIAVIVSLLLVLGALAAQKSYNNEIFHNVSIAGVEVGGLDKIAASEAIQKEFQNLVDNGLTVELFQKLQTIDLAPTGATDPDLVYPLLDLDVNALVEDAYQTGRNGHPIQNFFGPIWYATIGTKNVPAHVSIAETKLSEAIRNTYPDAESPGTPTDFLIKKEGDAWNITVTPAVSGATIDLEEAFASLKKDAEDLRISPLELELIERSSLISSEEAETLTGTVEHALDSAPYTLTFTDENTKANTTFSITTENLITWLQPGLDDKGQPVLTVDTTGMGALLADIHTKLDISPRDAVFVMEGDRVTEFEPSRDGVRVDDDALIASLEAAFVSGAEDVAISVERTEPDITTAESNEFGIKEKLGTGFSSFAGSPANRRANIKHGVSKLNGILIPPGETLSLLENLKPFTVADGYLPELVIKGDEIIPEVGGGLCQIGTTTFRAAMNSGLDIVERRNHSLVVSYYNDPANNNPGTDATIYDPAPDLKIKNDTQNHILLITEMDATKSELHFSFWGTSDGRIGSYTPPKVLSWTGYGETVTKETDSLPPGVKSCQSPHPGATASFTYNILRPDGNTTSREFVSTYRSLPTICLVGKATSAPPTPTDGGGGESVPLE